ncbi:histidine phosphatase family protein [Candidatus Synechococcus calcipolaris G9]|uniref:Histidine phosphatase family protein n=1 Tax=Candidatus Synechococcus calcipolaris G9 TaxID=1497997 RepID=A0ABT6F303_9SYNE|nr:histidine phosphatase family protein [Candidatus Synechococcus calcipolaris]MDG2992161.1 histidine phosphatase family protein [Candidatus Synechococcus calcipolaris G9]
MRLILIRHGEAQGNGEGQMLGHRDVALTDRGHNQAIALGEYLGQRTPPNYIYTSPLQRCRQTAEGLSKQLSLAPEIRIAPDLIELDQGIFTGLTWPEAKNQYPDFCHRLETQSELESIPGAESLEQGIRRTQEFWQNIFATHTPLDCLWLISHGGILQCLISTLLGCDRLWGISIPPGAWFDISVELDQDQFHSISHRHNPMAQRIHRFNASLPS